MKIRKLGVCFIVLLLMVSFAFASRGIEVYAAEVSEQLLEPEAGWKRIDNIDSNFVYEGEWASLDEPWPYANTIHNCTQDGGSVKFRFTGNKLRIISPNYPTYSDNIVVKIDGVEHGTFDPVDSALYMVIQYEILNLSDGEHTCEIVINPGSTTTALGRWALDAIDIDENGEMLPEDYIESPDSLISTAGDSELTLSWDEVTDADSYNVYRATTSGGPYTTVAEEVYGTSYTDTDVTNGTTYYYVVTAVNTDGESDNSDEASATPISSSNGNKALLRITMINGAINEYDITMDDVDTFIEWYEDRGDGNGDSYYVFSKDYNVGPFVSRTDYIAYDKILQFEVMEYTE